MNHTPGPWTCTPMMSASLVDLEHEALRPHYVLNPEPDDDGGILPPIVTRDEADANARLIAAAPDLYDALLSVIPIAAMKLLDADGKPRASDDPVLSDAVGFLRAAKALLSRIDGET